MAGWLASELSRTGLASRPGTSRRRDASGAPSAASVAYCFSYTVIVFTARPAELTPLVVVVMVLPSGDTVTVDFAAMRPPIFTSVS